MVRPDASDEMVRVFTDEELATMHPDEAVFHGRVRAVGYLVVGLAFLGAGALLVYGAVELRP
jgi:hypothetical protein